MLFGVLTCLVLVLGCVCAAPTDETVDTANVVSTKDQQNNDLNADASTYHGGYPGRNYVTHGVVGVVGYGYLDDKHTPYHGHGGTYDYSGYDRGGYEDYDGYGGYTGGYKGYGGGYKGYGGGYKGYGGGYKGYGGGYSGYDQGGYGVNSLYGNGGYGGYGDNGGYGGYGGNGGHHSYYGYNSPTYEGGYHLGYGYYGKNRGHGNIYHSGITPSLVTGYRGYSRR